MTVIDASVLAKFILKEDGWEKVIEYLKAGVFSVDHIFKEVTNAIWRRLARGEISPEEAKIMFKAMKEILGKAIKIEEENAYIDEAFEISSKRGITIYDSLYIALAKRKGLRLLTADESQAQAASAENISTIILEP